MPGRSFKPEFYVRTYELARSGLHRTQIGPALGVQTETFRRWYRDDPALRDAYHRGRGGSEAGRGETFLEYVYRRLPTDLLPVWQQLNALRDEENDVAKLEAVTANCGRRGKQMLYVHALLASNFNKYEACRKCGFGTGMVDQWVRDDPGFGRLLAEIPAMQEAFIEGNLMQLIAEGDTAATIFAAKTKLRKKGYDTRATVDVNHSGTVRHELVDVDDLDDLTPDQLRAVHAAIRANREKKARESAQPALPPAQPPPADDADDTPDAEVVHARKNPRRGKRVRGG